MLEIIPCNFSEFKFYSNPPKMYEKQSFVFDLKNTYMYCAFILESG